MATTGPMLVNGLSAKLASEDTQWCSCGRANRLFYRLWLGIGGAIDREYDEIICSFCFGERAQIVPFTRSVGPRPAESPTKREIVQFGHKLVLLPDPRATLTDEERADVQETPGKAALREWALQHGQGALPYRVENGLEWEKLAEFQWARTAADFRLSTPFPDGRWEFIERKDMRLVQVKQRRTPTAAEVALLEAARECWLEVEPHLCADLDLVWAHPIGEKARTELQVSLCTPNGGLRRLFYALPQ